MIKNYRIEALSFKKNLLIKDLRIYSIIWIIPKNKTTIFIIMIENLNPKKTRIHIVKYERSNKEKCNDTTAQSKNTLRNQNSPNSKIMYYSKANQDNSKPDDICLQSKFNVQSFRTRKSQKHIEYIKVRTS